MDRKTLLSKMILLELRPMAKQLRIKKYSSLTKDILINEIILAEKNISKMSANNNNDEDEDEEDEEVDEGETLQEIKKKLDELNKLFTTLIIKRA